MKLGYVALHSTPGPMARNVPDLALMLDAMCRSGVRADGSLLTGGWAFEVPPPTLARQGCRTPYANAVHLALAARHAACVRVLMY